MNIEEKLQDASFVVQLAIKNGDSHQAIWERAVALAAAQMALLEQQALEGLQIAPAGTTSDLVSDQVSDQLVRHGIEPPTSEG